jgi:hypothetical protein
MSTEKATSAQPHRELISVCLKFSPFCYAGLDPASKGALKGWIPAGVYPDENRAGMTHFMKIVAIDKH